MQDVPDFSGVAGTYATSRPGYPAELFAWLASSIDTHGVAWDTATGNGQAALGLANHFERVIATDRSEAQLHHAYPHPRVEYRVAMAEASELPGHSVDVVVAAAAIHWFDLPKFFDEVRRVLRSGGVLAAWSYHVAHVGPPFDNIFWPFYRDVVSGYFAEGALLVDQRYETLRLPGQHLEAPPFVVSAEWTAEEILRFVRTWSGVQSCIKSTGEDPVVEITPAVMSICGSEDEKHRLEWPLYLRASRL